MNAEELGLVIRGKEVHAFTSSITKESLIGEYSELFTGLGCFREPYDAQIESGTKPVIHPLRCVPISLQEKLKQKLDEMESEGVISKTDQPRDWVSSLVTVEKKDGSLRVCLDPRDLNQVIKREHFMIPTAQDVISQLGGKTILTVLDQKDSYWQVPETAKLFTFNTPFGRYSFQRMPFGISSASEVLQKRKVRERSKVSNMVFFVVFSYRSS